MATADTTAGTTPALLDVLSDRLSPVDAAAERLRDAWGRPRSPAACPGFNAGRAPGNKGREYQPDPPTAAEIVLFVQAIPDTPVGRRFRAFTLLTWRTGLRASEARALEEHDLDASAGSVLVRKGKGGKRRTAGMDPWGWEQIRPWFEERRQYPPGKLFCVLNGPTAGRAVTASSLRAEFRRTTEAAGLRKRIAAHQLRHAFSVEWVREGGPIHLLMLQLGHANLQVTTIYLAGLAADEVLDVSLHRRAPVMPLPSLAA